MGKKISPFSRSAGNAPYRRKIHLVSEGAETEPAYIYTLKELMMRAGREVPLIGCCKPKNSSISSIVKKAKEKESAAEDGDHIWIAVDRDYESHTHAQMQELRKWEKGKPCRHIAYSSPRFEFWLLLHFENSPSEADAGSDMHMEKYIKGYSRSKKWNPCKPPFTLEDVQEAISRAKRWGIPDYCDPPRVGTSFGELVKLLLNPL